MYENMEVEWVGGHTPTAFLYAKSPDATAEPFQVELGDFDAGEIRTLLLGHGFEMVKRKVTLGEPLRETQFEGKTYRVYGELLSWDQAQEAASNAGFRMLRLESEREDQFVNDWLMAESSEKHYWFGASDAASEGSWVWGRDLAPFFSVGAEPTGVFVAWASGEPNNSGDGENCGVIKPSPERGWYDRPCREMHQVVLEADATMLFVSGKPQGDSNPAKAEL